MVWRLMVGGEGGGGGRSLLSEAPEKAMGTISSKTEYFCRQLQNTRSTCILTLAIGRVFFLNL